MYLKNKRLASMRKEYKVSQNTLAQAVGLTQSMISHVEAGRKDVSKIYKIKIARYFNELHNTNVSVDWLFYEQVNDLEAYLSDSVS